MTGPAEGQETRRIAFQRSHEGCGSWQKLRERNEALDARVYARAAAWIAGLDRWSDERWAGPSARSASKPSAAAAGRTAESPRSPESWVGRRRGWLKRPWLGNESRRTDVGHE